jgi:hypothetical protein
MEGACEDSNCAIKRQVEERFLLFSIHSKHYAMNYDLLPKSR